MIKQIMILFAAMMFVSQVSAIEKNQINLDQIFWGNWLITNPSNSCTEKYQFKKPGQFIYQTQKKQLTGDFAVVRQDSNEKLDILVLDIQKDNGLAGCAGDMNNYQGKKSNFSLKWITQSSAEICTDDIGKECTGLYLNKK